MIKPTTWWFLVGTLLTLLFIVIVVVYSESLETLLLRETLAPQLEQEFGFTAAQIRPNPSFPDSAFLITRVQAGGAFARSGVLPGDRPWDYHGRFELQFYLSVRAAREPPVTIHVIRLPAGADIPKDVRIPIYLHADARPNSR